MPSAWAERIAETGSLLRGHFLLQSGRHARCFMRTAQLLFRPSDGELFADALVPAVAALNATVVFSSNAASAFLAAPLARRLGAGLALARTDAWRRPTAEIGTGAIGQADRVLVVTDFITTSASHDRLVETVRSLGVTMAGSAALTVHDSRWLDVAGRTALLRAHWASTSPGACGCHDSELLWPAHEFA